MNTRELDRLLCERLGIQALSAICNCGHYHGPLLDSCRARTASGGRCLCEKFQPNYEYPALSSTWDGMGRLMDALAEKDHYASVSIACVGFEACCVTRNKRGESRTDSAPLALALAAAAALGIEAPE